MAKEKECENCINHGTMDCPNSFYCYSTEDKPYFVAKEGWLLKRFLKRT